MVKRDYRGRPPFVPPTNLSPRPIPPAGQIGREQRQLRWLIAGCAVGSVIVFALLILKAIRYVKYGC